MGLFSLVKFKFDFSLTLRLPENAGRLTFAECRLHFSCVFRLVLGNGLFGVFIWGQEIAAVPFSKSVKLDSHSLQINCCICITERCVRNTMPGLYEELQRCRSRNKPKDQENLLFLSEGAEAPRQGTSVHLATATATRYVQDRAGKYRKIRYQLSRREIEMERR